MSSTFFHIYFTKQSNFCRLFFEDSNIDEKGKVALVNLLIKNDIINLVGRIILLPILERLKGANKRFWSKSNFPSFDEFCLTGATLH